MKNIHFLITAFLLLLACDETNTSGNTISDTQTSSSTNTEQVPTPGTANKIKEHAEDPDVELLGSPLEFDDFNQKIKSAQAAKEEWASSPLSIMLKYTGAAMDAKVKSIRSKQLGPGEIAEDVIVTVEEDGLMDDSISGTITMLRMKKEGDVWQVYKATRAWKCWKGRGHETYSGVPCG